MSGCDSLLKKMLPNLARLAPTGGGVSGDGLGGGEAVLNDEQLQQAYENAEQRFLELQPEWNRLHTEYRRAENLYIAARSRLDHARAGHRGLLLVAYLEREEAELKAELHEVRAAFEAVNGPYANARVARAALLRKMTDDRLNSAYHKTRRVVNELRRERMRILRAYGITKNMPSEAELAAMEADSKEAWAAFQEVHERFRRAQHWESTLHGERSRRGFGLPPW